MGLRTTLHDRLAVELLDTEVAGAVTQLLDNDTVAAINAMCDHAIATSPALSYRPSQRPGDQIDAVVAFSYGYRITPTPGHPASDIPPMEALSPGPVNELLAAEVAAFAAVRPMPIIAQWEIARVLDSCGVSNVISVEPDVSEDGTTVYLSTAGVLDKGLRLATATGLRPQCIGVVAHLDHAPRCVATTRAHRLDAAVIADVDLPGGYDPQSGQRWTRDRVTWIATDLYARTRLVASTDWNLPE